MDFLEIRATLKDLKAVITDPNLCLVFRGFLKEILGGENLSFVVEVRKYFGNAKFEYKCENLIWFASWNSVIFDLQYKLMTFIY